MFGPSKGSTVAGGGDLARMFARNMPAGPVGQGGGITQQPTPQIQQPTQNPLPVLGSLAPTPQAQQPEPAAPSAPAGYVDVGGKAFNSFFPNVSRDDYRDLHARNNAMNTMSKLGLEFNGVMPENTYRSVHGNEFLFPGQPGYPGVGGTAGGIGGATGGTGGLPAPTTGNFPSQAQLLARAINEVAQRRK